MENLKQLIDRLTGVFLPAAIRNQSFFVNDVPNDVPIDNNPQWVASVVSRMLSTVVNHVKKHQHSIDRQKAWTSSHT